MSNYIRRSVIIGLSVLIATFLMAGGAMAQTAGEDCSADSYPIPPGGCEPETEVGGDTSTPSEEPETDVGGGATVTPPRPEAEAVAQVQPQTQPLTQPQPQPQTQVLGTSTTPGQSTVFAQQGLASTGIESGALALLAVIGLMGGAGLILLGRKRV